MQKCIKANCFFEFEIIDFYGKCKSCPENHFPDPNEGKFCTNDLPNCKATQRINFDGRCKDCKDGKLRNSSTRDNAILECTTYEQPATVNMIEQFEMEPDWDKYNE